MNTENSYTGLTAFNHSAVEFTGGNLTNLDKDAIVLFNNSSINIKDLTISNIADDPISVFNTSTLSALNLTIKDLPSFDFPFTDVLALFNSSTLSIKNSNFEYCPGEACITFFNGNDYLANPVNLMIENTKFSGGTGSALLTFGAGESITNIKNSSIKNFINYGVENYSNITVNAENNDWGDKTGPYHITLNPDGLGQMIYGNIDFEPWVGQEGPIPDTFYAKIKNAPSGVAQMYMNANTSELVKTFPNDWILKVFPKTLTPDGWIKVQDMTDGSEGWMNTAFVYEESKQGEFENSSSVHFDGSGSINERKQVIVGAINNYFSNFETRKSLYSSDDHTYKLSNLVKEGFHLEVILAMIDQESGGVGYNNEYVTYDFGHGIMQSTMYRSGAYDNRGGWSLDKKSGGISSVVLKKCTNTKKVGDFDYERCYDPIIGQVWNDTLIDPSTKKPRIDSKTKRKGGLMEGVTRYKYAVYDYNSFSYDPLQRFNDPDANNPLFQDNPTYKNYANTVQSIYSNIKDGLAVLESKNGQVWLTPCSQEVAMDNLIFTCSEINMIKSICGYNGASVTSDDYLGAVSKKLKTLSPYFEDRSYSNTDQLIEKLAIAGKNRVELRKHSPIDIAIKDSQGNVVGFVDGEEKVDVPTGAYDSNFERAVIFFPDDTYTYEVVGDSEGGTYGVDIDIFDNSEEPVSFRAIDLPIIPGEKHIYKVNQDKLKNDEPDAVTITIDKDGDGVPERTIYSGNELSSLDTAKENPAESSPGAVPLWTIASRIKPLVLGAQTEQTTEQIKSTTSQKTTTLISQKIVKKSVSGKKNAIANKTKIELAQQKKEVENISLPTNTNSKKPNWFMRLWQLLFN
ncbi:MAG: right-handed parallel beta-helix repeat-containing protein [Candidatus Nomurabacteria bacterium]|nr:right-handed parallel beta-helix repeat-containing protein [Candidatus Nomurabacteria bacterium]